MAAATRIGTTIKRARERKRMSQQDLADALGVSRSAVNAWERDRAWPRSSIGALEAVLGISFDDEQPSGPLADLYPLQEDWEAGLLAEPDLPDETKRWIITESRADRAAYRKRKAGRRDPGRTA